LLLSPFFSLLSKQKKRKSRGAAGKENRCPCLRSSLFDNQGEGYEVAKGEARGKKKKSVALKATKVLLSLLPMRGMWPSLMFRGPAGPFRKEIQKEEPKKN
jgi:hypothetical protein